MKASLWGQVRYVGPQRRDSGWPPAASNYERELGAQSYEQGVELLEMGEELGYDWLSFAEHHFAGGRLTPSPLVMGAFMAARTKKAKIALLGPMVPTQNPVRIAEETAMLDNISGGRLVVGLLRGTPNEYQVVGINPTETRDRLMEGTELIVQAWTQPEPFGWEGKYYRYRTVSVWPRPQQLPHPPLYALDTSLETAEYAGAHHIGLGLSYEAFDFAGESAQRFRETAAAHGWEPSDEHIVYRGRIYVAENEDELEIYRKALERRPAHRTTSTTTAFVESIESTRRSDAHLGLGPAANFIGTPDMIIEQLRECHEQVGAGVIDLAFDPLPGTANVRTETFFDRTTGAAYSSGEKTPEQLKEEHKKLMRDVKMFGKEILPAMHEIG